MFAQPPVGLQPLTLDDTTLVVLCQAPHLVEFISRQHQSLVFGLIELLDGGPAVTAIRPVLATGTEIYLARELLALKLWLRDFDVGF